MAYPGGKGRCFQRIINLMPPHERYIETHLGGGAVMRAKRPAGRNIGIDLDERVVHSWADVPNVEVINGDAVDVLTRLGPCPGDMVYADPPYLAETRRRRSMYRHDYSERQHRELLAHLTMLPCLVMISGYASKLYDELLSGWHKVEFETATQAGPARETLWMNFRPGAVLHDYSYVGDDFRERERLRRRIRTLSDRLDTAEPLELHAALARLGETNPLALRAAAERMP